MFISHGGESNDASLQLAIQVTRWYQQTDTGLGRGSPSALMLGVAAYDHTASLSPPSHETRYTWLHRSHTGVPMACVCSYVDSRVVTYVDSHAGMYVVSCLGKYIDSCAGSYVYSCLKFVLLNAQLNRVPLDACSRDVKLLAAGLLEPGNNVAALGLHVVDQFLDEPNGADLLAAGLLSLGTMWL